MDIAKYLKNKDITLTNDDLDLGKLEKDIRKGYVSEEDLGKSYVSKEDFDSLNKNFKDLNTKYTETETNFNNINKSLTDTNEALSKTRLEKNMVIVGFKEEHFEEVSKLRSTLFAEEKDDKVALESVKDRFKGTYFPETNAAPTTPTVPNEGIIGNSGKSGTDGAVAGVNITRNTSINDLVAKK